MEYLETLSADEAGAPDGEAQVSPVLAKTGFVSAAAAILAACGGGGASGGGAAVGGATAAAPVVPVVPPITKSARFLAQSTMGTSDADVQHALTIGNAAWLDEQFATPRATAHWDWLVAKGYNAAANVNTENGFNETMWRQLIVSSDQLRQRVAMALLDIQVVGISGVNLNWKAFAMAAYVDVLTDGAFGNFRDLLTNISLNAATASFLTYLGNRKAAGTSVPDENYARELMQLYTIGLYQLNADGSLKKDTAGNPIETYTQADVSGLARVFTGFNLSTNVTTTPDVYRTPLIVTASQHETGSKVFLGTTIPAATDGMTSLKLALDAIFAHPNVAPFIGKQLIQRLVTSNPSAAYIGRVSAAFENNGAGVRGDLKAVIRAVLLDSEARDDLGAQNNPNFGKLREPITRLTGWARATGVVSPTDTYSFGDTSSTANRLGESPGRAQSVFGFFRPGYSPAGSPLSAAGLVGPEFQITNEPSVIAYINYMQSLIQSGAGDAKTDYAALQPLASDSTALLKQLNLVIAANQVSDATLASFKPAIDSIVIAAAVPGATTPPAGVLNRIYTAILLIMASPEYLALV